jgi:hypothetical protein
MRGSNISVVRVNQRPTSEQDQHGFQPSSLSILLTHFMHPRPRRVRRITVLKALVRKIYPPLVKRALGCLQGARGRLGEPASVWWFFEERSIHRIDSDLFFARPALPRYFGSLSRTPICSSGHLSPLHELHLGDLAQG